MGRGRNSYCKFHTNQEYLQCIYIALLKPFFFLSLLSHRYTKDEHVTSITFTINVASIVVTAHPAVTLHPLSFTSENLSGTACVVVIVVFCAVFQMFTVKCYLIVHIFISTAASSFASSTFSCCKIFASCVLPNVHAVLRWLASPKDQ